MTGIWWTSVSIEIFLCCLTATTAHLLMSLGQTLFHRYLGHRRIGGRFCENQLQIHHRHYSGDHVVSENYLNEEANNTPFFLIPITLASSLGYLALPLDLFIVQLITRSISFYVHLYFDKHYHVAGSWLGRFAWFRRKQQLHFLHHRYADCNFAVVVITRGARQHDGGMRLCRAAARRLSTERTGADTRSRCVPEMSARRRRRTT